ncbi:MAG: UDP-N-acetylmuramoyl-tripeptide--D-alanyl-D-alanine ligase [Actinomycetota bacterium]|nr:UDP-N-acetylmuramoyl-tripeptide--D-alanyl-D-alanine ligase [Actinomycetota bacterium]
MIAALLALSIAFLVFHYVRLKRALHVFQLEGYKRSRFLRWCRQNPSAALFLAPATQKKPLVMTHRAHRLLALAMWLSAAVLVGIVRLAALSSGAAELLWWAIGALLLFAGAPLAIAGTDVLLVPVERSVNRGFMRSAIAKLEEVAPVVIGVTGSFGKTSTKFAIQRLLDGGIGVALATPGSFNNPLGVSRAINEQLDARNRFFVVEMGAYGEGEIAELCSFVHPTIGVLTSIGPAHLDRFESMDVIRRAKYEIVASLPSGSTAVMNCDDPEVRTLADATTAVDVVRYGIDAAGEPHITATDVNVSATGASFVITDTRDDRSLPVRTKLLGKHSIGHVLAAVAVALAAGKQLDDLKDAIETLTPVEHRLQLLEGSGGVTVIDDAYNSNPDGADAALDVLASMPARRRVVVTPGMIELGDRQFAENERFGRRAAAVADVVVVVAKANREAIVSGARGARAELITVDSLAQATERVRTILGKGDVILFENDLPDHYEA